MRSSVLLSVLALAGPALATPIAHPHPAVAAAHEPLPPLDARHLIDSGCDHAQVRRRLEERVAKRAALQKRQGGSFSEGGSVTPGSGASGAHYSCDPNACKLPDCHCASATPPGNLDIKDVPMFITLTSDDAIQSYTMSAVDQFIGQRKNPNGCPAPSTYFVSLNYTNYTLLTENHVNGHQELACHTMYHVGDPPADEISGNLVAQNALGGIPFADIIGFRAPYLNYSANTLQLLHNMSFTYDSSSSSSVPVTSNNTDAFWPYTLDHGMANDCDSVEGICAGAISLPGQWEIPMYSIFGLDQSGNLDPTQPHLMDPYLDTQDAGTYLSWLKANFLDHYNGQKQPFGLYFHPIHLSTTYPGLSADTSMIDATNQFLDWATTNSSMQNVWMVTNKQLLAWMKNPVPASQLNTLPEFQCQVPNVKDHICNGLSGYLDLTENCFNIDQNMYFLTCYGCPEVAPSPQQPNPPQNNTDGKLRTRISDTCETAWWDPVAGKCLCNGGSCSFTDQTRPIGPNGANLTSNATTNAPGSGSANPAQSSDPYTPWGASGKSPAAATAHVAMPVLMATAALVGGVYVLL